MHVRPNNSSHHGFPTDPKPVSPPPFLTEDNPLRSAQLPPVATKTQSRGGILIPLLLGVIVLLIALLLAGFFVWKSNTKTNQAAVAAPTTITESVMVTPSSPPSSASDSTATTSAVAEDSAYQQSVSDAGLDAYGFSSMSCLGSDTWVFSAVSTDGHHVLICQSGSSESYYYTHDYLSDIYRKDVDKADVAAGEFEVYNDDATITIDPSGLFVKAEQGNADFASSFSTSFTTNPW